MKPLLALLWGRTARNSALTIGANILYGMLIIAFIVVISRVLGPERFGLFSICIAIFGLSFDVLSVGTSQSLIRFIALYRDKYPQKALQFTRAVLLLRMIESLVIMALSVAIAKFLAISVYSDVRLLLPLVITLALAGGNLLVDFFISYSQGNEQFRTSAIIALINAFTRILGLILLVITNYISILSAIIAFALGPWIAAAFAYVFTSKKYLKVSTPPAIVSELFHFSKWITLWSTTAALVGRVDVLLLGKLTSAYETGIYAAASRLVTGFILIGSSYASVLTPKIARTIHNPTDIQRLFKLVVISIILTIVGMVAIILLSPTIIPLVFGREYSSAISVFQSLTLGSIFFMASIPSNVSLLALGKAKFIGLLSLLQVIILLVLSLKLIPEFGAHGAAIALGSSYATTFIISSVYAFRKIFSS